MELRPAALRHTCLKQGGTARGKQRNNHRFRFGHRVKHRLRQRQRFLGIDYLPGDRSLQLPRHMCAAGMQQPLAGRLGGDQARQGDQIATSAGCRQANGTRGLCRAVTHAKGMQVQRSAKLCIGGHPVLRCENQRLKPCRIKIGG